MKLFTTFFPDIILFQKTRIEIILSILFGLNKIDNLKLKNSNLSFRFYLNSFSFRNHFRQRKAPNVLKKKENITSRFKARYCFFCLHACLPNFVSGCLMASSETCLWRCHSHSLFKGPKDETCKGWRTLATWGNFKMFSARAFVIIATDMWVRCPSNKSNSGLSFTDSANLKNHFAKDSVSIKLKKNLDLVTTSINRLIF